MTNPNEESIAEEGGVSEIKMNSISLSLLSNFRTFAESSPIEKRSVDKIFSRFKD